MVRKLMKNESGFSLIELLITVVIIGVLAAMGVPQYRKMVSKSRSAEAKVMLGAIFTAEQATLAEYGTYGNNIKAMGVNVVSPQAFVAGFSAANDCTIQPEVFPAGGTAPNLAGSGYAVAMASATEGSGALVGVGIVPNNVAPNPDAPLAQCSATAAAVAIGTYTARASGNVVNPRTACTDAAQVAAGTRCEGWSINQAGALINYNIGY